ncbi:MAG: hypothetical protein J6T74_02725, partial [Clostridia bacterium]|nr:hypothetical protein [Clostridia bacterium]
YQTKESFNFADISTMLQVQYFALNPDINSAQSNDTVGWQQNEEYQPCEIATDVTPLLVINNRHGVVKNYYSSFALKEIGKRSALRFPLIDDYSKDHYPLTNANMEFREYNRLTDLILKRFSIKINHVSNDSEIETKGKKDGILSASANYSNKIIVNIADFSKNGTRYSNIEKLIKIYDAIAGSFAIKELEAIKGKTKETIKEDVLHAARIFAVILLSRCTDYDNAENNALAEKCLWLQFANFINRGELTSVQLSIVTELGVNTAVGIATSLGLTTESIKEVMEQNGYSYVNEPTDIREALLFATESDYQKYTMPIADNYARCDKERIGIAINDDKQQVHVTSSELNEARNTILQLTAGGSPKNGNLLSAPNVNTALIPLLPQTSEQSDENIGFEFNKNAIRQSTIDKTLDEMIRKAISDRAISIARHISSGDYSEFGGKENCEKACSFLSNVLVFFQYLQVSKRREKILRAENYSLAQRFAIELNNIKINISDQILELNNLIKKEDNEKLMTYINRAYKEITRSKDSIRDGFKKMINKRVISFVNDKTTNI